MMADAALPAALFGLGGVLTRYAIRASLAEAGMITALSLVVHPAIAYGLAPGVFDLPQAFVRAAVVTAAMAPGVNTYVFASLYAPRPGPGGERHPARHRGSRSSPSRPGSPSSAASAERRH